MVLNRWGFVPVFALVVLIAGAVHLGAQEKDDRIGFAEEFDTMDGWKVTSGKHIESMKSENGIGIFDTYIGGFQTVRLPNQPVMTKGRVYVSKEYKQEVDFDKYHYIVMNIVEKNMMTTLYVNSVDGRKQTHVAASTGVLAQDITPLGLKGRQKVKFAFRIKSTGGACKVDYIRFVSRLTDEEKKVLLAPPLRLYKAGIKCHSYQGLEALWQRAPRAWSNAPKNGEEKVLFRDFGTSMPVWRLTATPSHEGMNGTFKPNVWRGDGSSISTPRRTYHFAKDMWDGKGGRHYTPRDYVPPKEKKEPLYTVVDDKENKKVIFKRLKPKPGEKEIIYEHPYPTKPYYWSAKIWIRENRLVAAFRGAEAILVCPEEKDEKKRVRVTAMLPIQSDKGCHLSSDGRYISLSAPFGSYHNYKVDLVGQKTMLGTSYAGGHGIGGSPWSILPYGGNGKTLVHRNASAPGNYTPGKDIIVYGVWLDRVSTDYGEMTKDCRYGITNGWRGGELDEQYVMFDRFDAGTILRLCTYNVSYETWDLRAKVSISLDYTKLAYATDMLATADYYITTIRRPDTPVEVKAQRGGGGVKLSWKTPINYKEIKGYNIYRSGKSGLGYKRVNKEFVKGTEFTDSEAPVGKAIFYMVATEENSGLMSIFSPEVSVGLKNEPVILHYEAEAQKKARPVRDVVDGYASAYRAVRLTKLAVDESVGTFTISTNLPRKGNYVVWGRCRGYQEENKGKFTLKLGAKSVGDLPVTKGKWVWVKSKSKISLAPDSKLAVSSGDESIMIDKIIITDDDKYTPRTADDRKAAPPAVRGLKATNTTVNSVELAWEPSPDVDLYCYTVYVGQKADFTPGNETILCSTRKTATADWGIKPGTKYYYKVVALDKLGGESGPAAVEAETKQLKPVTVELSALNARASGGMVKGEGYVEYPNAAANDQSLTFEFETAADGKHYIWIQYTPTFDVKANWMSLNVSLDGKTKSFGLRPRSPRGGKWKSRWFFERMLSGENLKAGKHSMALNFGKRTKMGQRVAKLWVTNDGSFAPPGYTPQAMFRKPSKWERIW